MQSGCSLALSADLRNTYSPRGSSHSSLQHQTFSFFLWEMNHVCLPFPLSCSCITHLPPLPLLSFHSSLLLLAVASALSNMHVPGSLVGVLKAPQFACDTTPCTTFCPSFFFFQASSLSFLSVRQILKTIFFLHFFAPPPPPVVAWVRGSMVEACGRGLGWGGERFPMVEANDSCPMMCLVLFCPAV